MALCTGWIYIYFKTIMLMHNVISRFGGDGGSETRHVDIPEGFRLVGFYGGERVLIVLDHQIFAKLRLPMYAGVGGHLHNIGIVIESLSGQPRCVLPNSATYTSIDKIILVEKLLEAFDRLILWNASMFSFNQVCHDCQSLVTHIAEDYIRVVCSLLQGTSNQTSALYLVLCYFSLKTILWGTVLQPSRR